MGIEIMSTYYNSCFLWFLCYALIVVVYPASSFHFEIASSVIQIVKLIVIDNAEWSFDLLFALSIQLMLLVGNRLMWCDIASLHCDITSCFDWITCRIFGTAYITLKKFEDQMYTNNNQYIKTETQILLYY